MPDPLPSWRGALLSPTTTKSPSASEAMAGAIWSPAAVPLTPNSGPVGANASSSRGSIASARTDTRGDTRGDARGAARAQAVRIARRELRHARARPGHGDDFIVPL